MAKGATATKDEEVTETENTETEGTETEAEAKATRPKTQYFSVEEMESLALDDLPDNPKVTGSRGRSKVYFSILENLAEQGVDRKWRPIAKFGTGTGARTVANSLNRQVQGKIGEGKGMVKESMVKEIPSYEGHTWVFDARRVVKEGGEGQDSILYAKLLPSDEVPAA